MKKNKNLWKYAFLLILSFNIFFVLYIVWPVKENSINRQDVLLEEGPTLFIETNKGDLTGLINHFIEQEYGDQLFNYTIQLTNDLILYGNLSIFGQDVQVELIFQVEPLENGDLRLIQKEMSIGNLSLPVSLIMNLIARAYQFPEWVQIQPSEETIYLHLTQIELANDLRLRINELDLPNDKISFKLFVNKENN